MRAASRLYTSTRLSGKPEDGEPQALKDLVAIRKDLAQGVCVPLSQNGHGKVEDNMVADMVTC